jgi:hypothetical protein
MRRHSVCYNSCSAFGLVSETPPLPNHNFELYLSQYSSNNPQAAIKRSSLDDNLLICFMGGPPNITDRLSVVLDTPTPVNSPTPVHVVTQPPIQGTISIMQVDQQLLDSVCGEDDVKLAGNEVSIVDNGYDSDPYESNADKPEGKDHEVDQCQN